MCNVSLFHKLNSKGEAIASYLSALITRMAYFTFNLADKLQSTILFFSTNLERAAVRLILLAMDKQVAVQMHA